MKNPINLLTLFLALLLCAPLRAADFRGAKWISADKLQPEPNRWICFRKQFDLNRIPEKAEIGIAVDSKYWLWVNGELAVFEGQLKRGPNRRDTYYDTVDIAPWLREGENTIAFLVWFFGQGGFNHNDSGTPGLIVSGDLGGFRLLTDDTWKAKLHPAYGTSNPPHPNGRLPESNVRFDAGKDLGDWTASEYNDGKWRRADIQGSYPCAPWNALVPRPVPNWRDMGLASYDSVIRTVCGDTTVVAGFLPNNLSITPYLKIRAPKGLLIDIRTDNYMMRDKSCNVRAEYITREGVQEFEALAYMNGHKVLYTLPAGVEVLDVKYRETRYDTEYEGEFVCDDPFLNTLWQKSLHTMNLNMRDCIQDPDRERAQWWGDAVVVLGEILYSCDQRGRDLIRKAICNLADWQRPDSILFSPIPAGSTRKELPGQMLASLGKYGFRYYYYYTGDRATIAHVYPAVKRYLGLWTLDERGLVVHRDGDWNWHDWGSDVDTRMLDNAWYYLALEGMADMADVLGQEADAAECRAKMARVKEAVNRYFWTGELYRSPEYKKGRTDDRANGMAAIAGFADRSKWEKIRPFLSTEFRAGPYLEKFILESFFLQGDAEGGLARMKARYREMVESPLTTLWEYWHPGGSINHGWAGGPMVVMSQYVAGIEPTSVGWKTFRVAPRLGHLKQVRCAVPTVRGTIRAEIADTEQGYSVKVTTVTACEFEIRIARDKCTRHIVVDGKAFPFALLKKIKTATVKYDHEDDSGYYFKSSSNSTRLITR